MHVFGLQVAGLTALALFAPHLIWLISHDFKPLQYAMASSLAAGLPWGARLHEIANWWGDQLFNRALPAWLFLAVSWLLGRRARRAAVQPAAAATSTDAASRALLLSFGLTPLLFVSVMTLVSGSHIQLHWGTPFLLFIVPAAMELARGAWAGAVQLRHAVWVFLVIQLLLMVRVELTSPTGAAVSYTHLTLPTKA